MNLQVGNREKVAGMIIFCLVAIGAVHWFIFMSKGQAYRQAFEDYQTQRGQWTSMVSSQQESQINKFIQQTQTYEDFASELARDLNVQWEPMFFDNSKEGIKKRQDRLLELIGEVCDLRKRHAKIRLTFLDWRPGQPDPWRPTQADPGWDIPSELPTGIPLWDLVERLKNNALTLRVLDNPLQREMARQEYNNNLMMLRVNPDILDPNPFNPNSLAYRYGDLVPLIKKVAHARLIWAQKEKEEKVGNIRLRVSTLDELYDLFEIRLPDNPEVLLHAIKQLQFLLQLMDLAEKQGIEEINRVVLLPTRKIDVAAEEENKARLLPEQHFDHFFLPEQEGVMPGTPGWPVMPGYPRPGWPGWPGAAAAGGEEEGGPIPGTPGIPSVAGQPGMAQFAVPEPVPLQGGVWMGNAVPIQVGFIASWETALDFVWVISHNRNPFEIDQWKLKTTPQGGRIQNVVTTVPIAWVGMIEGLYAPAVTTGTAPTAVAAAPQPAAAPAPAAPPPAPAATPAPPITLPSRLGGGIVRKTPAVELP